MYCRKVRIDQWPKFIIVVSLFTDRLSDIVPPAQRKCIYNICAMMPYVYSPRARTDNLTVLLICRGCILAFMPLV